MSTSGSPSLRPTWVEQRASVHGQYALPIETGTLALSRGWLWLGLVALLGSGLFSILLVLARTPGINTWLPGVDFFRVALVVHVDLSVLVWFVAIAGVLWNLGGARGGRFTGWLALAAAALGTAMMAAAPFVDRGPAVMSNYIPVIESRTFLSGLVVFGVGTAIEVFRALLPRQGIGQGLDGAAALRFGLYGAALAAAIALLAFAWAYAEVDRGLDPRAYWEILFWGGGHALQFTWTLLMLVAWLWLAHACGAHVPLSPRVAALLLSIALAGVLVTPMAYLLYEVHTAEHRWLHTMGMRVGGGLAILPIALAVVLAFVNQRGISERARPLRAALASSMLLFAAGGLIGVFIDGDNVRVPAHYHGCIVGVSLALMGLVYHLLPRMGYAAPQGRLAVAQPLLYGAGQLMHIVGLVWSGGYGVQRKVAGTDQMLNSAAEVFGMAVMGLGGIVAIAGGFLFVLIVFRSTRGDPDADHSLSGAAASAPLNPERPTRVESTS